jgi:membrane protein implicated in regulation of membrane protease activity
MEMWIWWVVVGIILIIAEMASFTFYLLWLGVGALAAALTAWIVPDSLLVQVIVGGVVTIALTVFTRPLTRKVRQSRGFKDAIDELVGKRGEVMEAITPETMGIVKVGTESWSATGDEPIAKGESVKVVRRSSTVVHVERWGGE